MKRNFWRKGRIFLLFSMNNISKFLNVVYVQLEQSRNLIGVYLRSITTRNGRKVYSLLLLTLRNQSFVLLFQQRLKKRARFLPFLHGIKKLNLLSTKSWVFSCTRKIRFCLALRMPPYFIVWNKTTDLER